MITLLSKVEAEVLMRKALVVKDEHYRLGQALWNLMPRSASLGSIATDKDFYYETDEGKVVSKFYAYFVEPHEATKGEPV